MEYSDLVYACRLSSIFGYSPRKSRAILERFPSLYDLFSLSTRSLEEIFKGHPEYIEEIRDQTALENCEKDLSWAYNHDVKVLFINDREFPQRLKECEDAPIVLNYRGNADLNSQRMVSIVGSRRATTYGKQMCREIVEHFSTITPAPIIISGLAFGVDITAHQSAMDTGLSTIGVMATGLDTIYPIQHRNAAAKMVTCGGVISDFPKGTTPLPINFIRRNRIIAGLSDATILIESDETGGGIITAKMADSYSKPVFALPGKITDKFSKGCNMLISSNIAEIIDSVPSVSRKLGWEERSEKTKKSKPIIFQNDNAIKRKILVALSPHLELDVNSLSEAIGYSVRDTNSALTELEMDGRITVNLNGAFSLM